MGYLKRTWIVRFIPSCQVDAEDMSSKCKKVAGIDSILLGELRKHLPLPAIP